MASVALGNLFTSLVNVFILNDDGSSKLDGPAYYLFFCRGHVGYGFNIYSCCHEVS